MMLFTVEEMEIICSFHFKTLSATLDALREMVAKTEYPVRKKAAAETAIKKLSEMKPGDTVSLVFEPEK